MHFPKPTKALVIQLIEQREGRTYTEEEKAAVMEKLTDIWVENPQDDRLEQMALDVRTNGQSKTSSGSHRIANLELVRMIEAFIGDWCNAKEVEDE
jgi:hypothetical protein